MPHNPRWLPVPTNDFHAGSNWRLRFDYRGVWKPSIITVAKWRGRTYRQRKPRGFGMRLDAASANSTTFFPRLKALVAEQFPEYTKVEMVHGFDGSLILKFTR